MRRANPTHGALTKIIQSSHPRRSDRARIHCLSANGHKPQRKRRLFDHASSLPGKYEKLKTAEGKLVFILFEAETEGCQEVPFSDKQLQQFNININININITFTSRLPAQNNLSRFHQHLMKHRGNSYIFWQDGIRRRRIHQDF